MYPRPLLSMADIEEWSVIKCKLLVAHVRVGQYDNGTSKVQPFIVKRNPTQSYSKCHSNENFPRYCDWPMGEVATFELALLLNIKPQLPLILGGVLDNEKVLLLICDHPWYSHT